MQGISFKTNHKHFDKKVIQDHLWECAASRSRSGSLSQYYPQRKEFQLFSTVAIPSSTISSVSVGKLQKLEIPRAC